jgi:hypothetical protein
MDKNGYSPTNLLVERLRDPHRGEAVKTLLLDIALATDP